MDNHRTFSAFATQRLVHAGLTLPPTAIAVTTNQAIVWFVAVGLLVLIIVNDVVLKHVRHREVRRLVNTVCHVTKAACDDGEARTKRVAEAAQLARDINAT